MREIDPDQLATALDTDVTVVDVREAREYADGHVPGAVNIPMGRLTGRLDEIDRSAPVYVVCATGNRSSAMTDLLITAGFDAYNVAGGTTAWTRSGRPTHK
jgi:rhodanese-related sulfurtransferase